LKILKANKAIFLNGRIVEVGDNFSCSDEFGEKLLSNQSASLIDDTLETSTINEIKRDSQNVSSVESENENVENLPSMLDIQNGPPMTFKDQLKKDLDVFINPDEFGELHKLGTGNTAKEIMMVIEEDSNNQNSDGSDKFDVATQNMYEALTTIYLKSSDYKKPAVGRTITLDDKKYTVANASVSDGILKIQLVAYESNG